MNHSPAFVSYEFADRNEHCLSAGMNCARNVLLVPPLFDEMNRMRKMLVDVMRALEKQNVGSVLPDLPGCNESLADSQTVTLDDWTAAVQACAQQHQISHIASFRGGVLTVSGVQDARHWIFSPVKGATLLRTLMRARVAADREAGLSTSLAELAAQAENRPIELAGNMIGSRNFAQLNTAPIPDFADQRIVRLDSDSKPADVHVAGSALWLRAEPDDDVAMSSAIAADIAGWIAP